MKKNFILLVIFLILFGFYWFYEKPKKEKGPVRDYQIWNFEPEKVEKIILVRPENELTLFKSAGGWYFDTAGEERVENSSVEEMVRYFSQLDSDQQVLLDDPEQKVQFGILDNKGIKIVLTDGVEKTLWLGDQAPLSSEYYVWDEESGQVYVVNSVVKMHIEKTKEALKWVPSPTATLTATITDTISSTANNTATPTLVP